MNRLQKAVVSILVISIGVLTLSYLVNSLILKKPSIAVSTSDPNKVINLPTGYTIAGWVWQSPKEFESKLTQTLDFSRKEGINTIYLYIDEYIDIFEMPESDEKASLMTQYINSVKKIVREAKASNISVQALSGNPTYAYDSHEYIPPILLEHVYNFNKENPDTLLDGIQFDIEFYEDKRFFGSKAEYTRNYLNLIDTLNTKHVELNTKSNQNLKLGFAIPFWFDELNEYMDAPIIDDIVSALSTNPNSYLVVMAYRNVVEGEGGIIEVTKDELEITKKYPVKLIIAQELVESKEVKITHYGKSRQDIKEDFKKIIELSNVYPSFVGISIHDLAAFMETK